MPFIRQTRDKRGIECLYVMHAYRPAPTGPQRTRVLYLFRSPAHLKIGRKPLDTEVMEALEHTHPDLAFDWSALHRESVPARPPESREREPRRDRPRNGNVDARPRPQPAVAPPPIGESRPAASTDLSLLARTLGAATAARLRMRFEELQLRVARRSRTPEERDRLTGRLQSLNPDSWTEEAAIQAGAAGLDAQLDAILAELPARRRGRRGGRRRGAGAIMAGDASPFAGSEHASLDERNRTTGNSDDGGTVGTAAPDPDPGFHGED